ncbi:hypothetical protein L1987_55404 [Smallanthus sonchifolius]|uniref:Uncharacterized protein n=1 Tax=Smallanthus sonchifolius TaxID=185202 RepID=A0ACB9EA93_9ASTR|nr:hypothetical protein L1987_55404 [Smallanthus sonchifolius]
MKWYTETGSCQTLNICDELQVVQILYDAINDPSENSLPAMKNTWTQPLALEASRPSDFSHKNPIEVVSMLMDVITLVEHNEILIEGCLRKYTKVAYHGFSSISKRAKVATYWNTSIKEAFDGPYGAYVDALFPLAEPYSFAQLLDFKDSNQGKISEVKE